MSSSRAKRFSICCLAAAMVVTFVAGIVLAFGSTRNAFAAELLTLDFNGTEAKIGADYAAGSADSDETGVFGGNATGYTAWSSGIAHDGILTIELGQPVTAADYAMVKISMVVGNWVGGTTTTTGYAVTDTAYSNPAGSADTAYGNVMATITLDSSKLADADGKIQTIVLRRTETDTSANGQYFFDYVQFIPAPEPQETLLIDFDGSQVTMDVPGGVDSDNLFGLFAGNDGSTKLAFTSGSVQINGTVTFRLATPVSAESYTKMRIRMIVGNAENAYDGKVTTSLYAANDTAYANPAGFVTTAGAGNIEETIELDSAAIADEDGMVRSFVLRRTGDMYGQYFFDYLYFYTPEAEDDYSSKHLQAGDLVAEANPAGIEDDSVTWLTLRRYTHSVPPYTTVDSVGLGDLRTWPDAGGTVDATLPDAPIYGGAAGDATCGVRAGKIVWALNVGSLKAENYAQFSLTFCFTDWLFGTHQFYLYGSGTNAFTNADGAPVGYAAELTAAHPSTQYKVTINGSNVNNLADAFGNINYLYIVWWGNVNDTAEEIVGTYNGTQLYVNEVNFLIDEDVEHPTESAEYIEKDLSALLPVGEGVPFALKSNGETDTAAPGYGQYTVLASAEVKDAYDAVEFTITPTYTESFSFYILLKAPGAATTYAEGGVTLWMAHNNTLIGTSAGEGKYSTAAQKMASDYNGAFASGMPTTVRIEMIPGYLEGVQSGYFLHVYLNGGEEAFLSAYIENASVTTGNYINIVAQDLGHDYSVELAGAAQTVTPAAEVMGVTLTTNSGNTTFTTQRAKLNMEYMRVEGEQVSDLNIEGNAEYNADTGFLTFNAAGTVKVSYTVTNAFGTFTSNVLELTYQSGGTSGGDVEEEPGGCGCGSSIGISSLLLCAIAVLVPSVVLMRKKRGGMQ